MEDAEDRFFLLLNRISQRATNEHVRGTKLLLRGKMTRKQMEQCTDMKDILDKLMMKALISKNDISLLKYLNAEIFENTISDMLDEYERPKKLKPTKGLSSNSNSCGVSQTASTVTGQPLPNKFQNMFEHAAKHLGADWKVMARLMGVLEHEVVEIESTETSQYKQSMAIMYSWYKRQDKASTIQLRNILRSIPRNDIADDLEELFHI